MGVVASQITSLTIVYSAVYSDADQRKHPFDDVIMNNWSYYIRRPRLWLVSISLILPCESADIILPWIPMVFFLNIQSMGYPSEMRIQFEKLHDLKDDSDKVIYNPLYDQT